MWKLISLTLVIFLITISCANQEATNAPSPSVTDEAVNTPSLGAHFPQKINTPNTYMEMLIKGELVLDNGCLRVSDVDGVSIMLIWDSRFSTRTEQGVVQVIDNSTGEVLASVGDFVAVGGGSAGTNPTELDLKESIPDECPGPYYLVGESIKKIDRP